LKSGRSIFPQAGQTMLKRSFSSSVFNCLFKLPSSVLVISIVSFIGCMSLTSVRTLRIRSLTCASVSLSDSTVSYMRSKSSLLLSKICASVVVWFFTSDSILFRKVSTGLSKAIKHVIAHRMTVEAAEM
jgi:hypothetical protein